MWGWLPGCLLLSGPWVVWAGRGCVRGRQLAVALASRLCGGGGGGWLSCEWCRRHARLLLLPACVGVGAGGCSRVRGVCVCGGGMLSGFWGSAPWLPGLLFCFPLLWVVGVGVGGLVVNCIVDASILL